MKRCAQALVAALCVLAIALQGGLLAMAAGPNATGTAAATPIIAEVYGRPDEFVGRRVAIYGLVVEARNEGQRFLLQDVSQMPLAVTAPPGQRVAVGSQLMVTGTLRRIEGRLELAGHDLLPVQVVAGGGCC